MFTRFCMFQYVLCEAGRQTEAGHNLSSEGKLISQIRAVY
jgi:hypothetical protein